MHTHLDSMHFCQSVYMSQCGQEEYKQNTTKKNLSLNHKLNGFLVIASYSQDTLFPTKVYKNCIAFFSSTEYQGQ